MHKGQIFILGNPNGIKPNKCFSKENQYNTRTIPNMKMNLNMGKFLLPLQQTLTGVVSLQRE